LSGGQPSPEGMAALQKKFGRYIKFDVEEAKTANEDSQKPKLFGKISSQIKSERGDNSSLLKSGSH
jgi:hypothetical protein